jgi:hypothetical protein
MAPNRCCSGVVGVHMGSGFRVGIDDGVLGQACNQSQKWCEDVYGATLPAGHTNLTAKKLAENTSDCATTKMANG